MEKYISCMGSPIWKLNSNGIFSVHFVNLAIKFPPALVESYPFMPIWKSKIPKKCKFFIWIAIYKGILTIETIQHRIRNICLNSNWCIMCKNNIETTYHLFLYYPSILSLRSNVKVHTGWINNLNNLRDNFKHICSINTKSLKVVIHINLPVATTWIIWLERNKNSSTTTTSHLLAFGRVSATSLVYGLQTTNSSKIILQHLLL